MSKTELTSSELNVIANGTTVKGEIVSNGDFRVDGTIEGTITSKGRIIVGVTGIVKGTITAENIDILGKVEGEMFVSNTLALKASSKVQGNIQTEILDIEQKAVFNGSCRMGKPIEPAKAAPIQNNASKK